MTLQIEQLGPPTDEVEKHPSFTVEITEIEDVYQVIREKVDSDRTSPRSFPLTNIPRDGDIFKYGETWVNFYRKEDKKWGNGKRFQMQTTFHFSDGYKNAPDKCFFSKDDAQKLQQSLRQSGIESESYDTSDGKKIIELDGGSSVVEVDLGFVSEDAVLAYWGVGESEEPLFAQMKQRSADWELADHPKLTFTLWGKERQEDMSRKAIPLEDEESFKETVKQFTDLVSKTISCFYPENEQAGIVREVTLESYMR